KNRDAIDKSLTASRGTALTAGAKAQMANQEKKLAVVESRILEAEEFLKEARAAKSEQLGWLETALANSTARWKVVFLHHAIYSSAYKRRPSHGHGKDKNVLALRALLKDKFMENRVDVVFAGHDHVFEKTKMQKSATTGHQITYITSGAASELRQGDLDKKKSPFFEFGEDRQHSFLVVRVNNDDLQIDVINRLGENIFPRFSIRKQ
ncbi:MAG TPA: metallophosphoesterase, partial [Pyrinomonadaceae bacterium]|nr:metallophosphoesterase [Pyrinomonadaceae bacterium]